MAGCCARCRSSGVYLFPLARFPASLLARRKCVKRTSGRDDSRREEANPIGTAKECPKIIEMVGVAGSGKSTLLTALGKGDSRLERFPLPPRTRYLSALARIHLVWFPIHLAKYRNGRWFTWDEIKNIGYLDAWLRYIRTLVCSPDVIAVLDPGSVYWLSSLKELGPPFTGDKVFRRWWEEKLDQWCSALDMIIWLEAPHEMLLQRVISRDEWHEAKSRPPAAVLEEFARLGVSYEKLISEMVRRKKLRVFHYRTDQVPAERILAEIDATVQLGKRILAFTSYFPDCVGRGLRAGDASAPATR
jgi:hypothetical protein